ncbi:hypothetical protein BVG79_01297 [Ketogulonicigenium robustum]|uniref:Uncharacterized protein n=1 Tax=Ketogulonicigenium robustum TaxID=92947 RepID=A0A1W6NZS4_9RHOB|nr:hypothetical protein BVG79_01297 [Ketogulonicigenium robustum]
MLYGDSGRGEAVQDGNSGLELGDLTIEASGGVALAQPFHAVHLASTRLRL